jgi:hypothetical protein
MKMPSTCRDVHPEPAALNQEAAEPTGRNQTVFAAARQVMGLPHRPVRKIAFEVSEDAAAYSESS